MSFSQYIAIAAGLSVLFLALGWLPNAAVPVLLFLLAIYVELREQRRVY